MAKTRLCTRLAIVLTVLSAWLTGPIPLAHAGDDCGSKEGRFNQFMSAFVVPDYFPPETAGARAALAFVSGGLTESFEVCTTLGRAPLKNACYVHDRCYERLGANKGQCDRDLREGWIDACNHQYENVSLCSFQESALDPVGCAQRVAEATANPLRATCREACKKTAVLLSEAQRFNNTNPVTLKQVCPSCDAFCEAQTKTLEQVTANGVFVDRSYSGIGIGTRELPYSSLGQAVKLLTIPDVPKCSLGGATVPRIVIRGGSYPERPTLAVPVLLVAEGGPVTIGK